MESRIICGDALETMRGLPPASVQCVITSPPYYWQRDYGVEGQLGHEETPAAYVSALVAVFSEAWRILRDDGVLFLNLGDTYYSGKGKSGGLDTRAPARNFSRRKLRAVDAGGWDIPRKSLLLMPARVALALQEDGWTLRSDIIWWRENAQPEPGAKDRPHNEHEHVFVLAKSRHYSFDRSALEGSESVWRIPCVSDADHSATFPEALVRRCILAATQVGDVVLDPFMGSGTSCIVAQTFGRHYLGIDLSPKNVRTARRRLESLTENLWSA